MKRTFSEVAKVSNWSATQMKRAFGLATISATAFAGMSIKTSLDYETAMNRVAAKTKLPLDGMAKLRKAAEEIGSTTQFTAVDAANAMVNLAQAGKTSVKDITGILQKMSPLAIAGGTSLTDASNIALQAMDSFKIGMEGLPEVSDILINATDKANVNMFDLAGSFKNVGGSAESAGFSFKQMSTALVLMAKTGKKGEDAGTGLRTVLRNLGFQRGIGKQVLEDLDEFAKEAGTSFSFVDDKGILVKDFAHVIKQFENFRAALIKQGKSGEFADDKVSQVATLLFGGEGEATIKALVSGGSELFKRIFDSMDVRGTTEAQAKIIGSGLPKAFTDLSSSLEGLRLALTGGDMGKLIESIAESVTKIVRGMIDWTTANNNVFTESLITNMQEVSEILKVLAGPLMIGALASLGTTMATAFGPIGLAAFALSLLVMNFDTIKKKIAEFEKSAIGIATAPAFDAQFNALDPSSVGALFAPQRNEIIKNLLEGAPVPTNGLEFNPLDPSDKSGAFTSQREQPTKNTLEVIITTEKGTEVRTGPRTSISKGVELGLGSIFGIDF